MEWMLLPLRRYADFSGRSRRKEYWMWVLLQVIVYAVLFGIMISGMPSTDEMNLAMADPAQAPAEPGTMFYLGASLLGLYMLATFIPSIAVVVRRLHDTDKSGWWYLINFIPFGGIVLLVFMCTQGTMGDNRFGPDPLDPANAAAFH